MFRCGLDGSHKGWINKCKKTEDVSLQVNETLLRGIVSQPSDHNYVYASSFAALNQVRNLLGDLTCRVVTRYPTTMPPSTLPPAYGAYICSKSCQLFNTPHEFSITTRLILQSLSYFYLALK